MPYSAKLKYLMLMPLFALGFLAACGADTQDHAELFVTNGQEIGEHEFPSTVLLMSQSRRGSGICTATFVNDRQALTASHCVAGLSATNPEMFYVSVVMVNGRRTYHQVARATSYHVQPRYTISLNSGVNKYDLAIVNFPSNTAPAVSRIAGQTPTPGSQLVIVGYGNNENYLNSNGSQGGSGSGIKRYGWNYLSTIDDGMLVFVGFASSQTDVDLGVAVSSGSGDSGGPMFVNGELVGVTSGGGLAETNDGTVLSISRYVDLNSSVSREFLNAYLVP